MAYLDDQTRLLVCRMCSTIEELPDYAGPEGGDHLLEKIVERHRVSCGAATVGGSDPDMAVQHERFMARVETKHWKNPKHRKDIIQRLSGTGTGFSAEVYAVRNTYAEDALKCYSKHNRPKMGCIDWHDHSKVITNDLLTPDDLKQMKNAGVKRSKNYLCDFCPVASNYVQYEKFKSLNLYK